jgi:hypothetical protein
MIPPKKPLNERLRGLFTAQRPLAPQDVTAGPSGPGAAAGVFPGLLQAAGEVALGAVPGVGQAMDVRDFEQARREGSPLGMALAAAGGVPVAGDVVKQIGKAGRKAVQAARELPMDEASRMARAQEMGFTTPVYHGTRATRQIESFTPQRGPQAHDLSGIHVGSQEAATDRLKKYYGINKNWSTAQTPSSSQSAPSVMPLQMKMEKPFAKKGGAPFTEAELRAKVKAFAKQRGIKESSIDAKIAFERHLADQGFDVIPYVNSVEDRGNVSYLVLRPENLRSQFARFDPAQAGSSNLMAGLGALFAGGAAMNRRDEDQP